jgi:hypothetical protein
MDPALRCIVPERLSEKIPGRWHWNPPERAPFDRDGLHIRGLVSGAVASPDPGQRRWCYDENRGLRISSFGQLDVDARPRFEITRNLIGAQGR